MPGSLRRPSGSAAGSSHVMGHLATGVASLATSRAAEPGSPGAARIVRAMADFPDASAELTHILVVEDIARSRDWYRDVLGAELYREFGGTSVVFRFIRTWLLLVTGGGPNPDKPDVTFAAPADPATVVHSMTIRVADCHATHGELTARGARFLTPPVEYDWEIRAFFRDPDGHLFEISEARSRG